MLLSKSLHKKYLIKNYSKRFNSTDRDFKILEKKWSKQVLQSNEPVGKKSNFYCLTMFPYPSGNLHMGHARVYSISDAIARAHRLRGFKVLHPMGWDAFGLPAENAAMERKVAPDAWTMNNMERGRLQMDQLGLLFDWDKEVVTCRSDYYRWTQWLFLKLKEKGLAYQKDAMVNWDPVDKTVLANEQVDRHGRSWRSGAIAEKKQLKQWFFKITEYAEQLHRDLEQLSEWPDAVKKMQQQWIGKSSGTVVHFSMEWMKQDLTVFTTRADTIGLVAYLAIAPEHDVVQKMLPYMDKQVAEDVKAFVDKINAMPTNIRKESITMDGIHTGLYAQHPITKEKIPIYLATYVLADYAYGSIMGVPAHDARDLKFANAHNIDIPRAEPQTGSQKLKIAKIEQQLKDLKLGHRETKYKLRDWLVSRQRYWGAPVPIIHCKTCGPVGVPESDLPVELPKMDVHGIQSSDDSGSPLSKYTAWKKTKCPTCGSDATRDTDTLDTFVDSSWYYLRYTDANNSKAAFSKESVDTWLPKGVDLYIGGIEHAILHLLYSRFISKVLFDQKQIPHHEPFAKLLTQGMVLGRTYKDKQTDRYLTPDELTCDEKGNMIQSSTSLAPKVVWEKMSKSKHNGVNPSTILSKYGADVTRLAILFKAPPSIELEWNEADITGHVRWLARIWHLIDNIVDEANNDIDTTSFSLKVNDIIENTSNSMFTAYSLNVAIAELMKLSNVISDAEKVYGKSIKSSKVYKSAIESLVIMLSPLAPYNAAEMYSTLVKSGNVHEATWPRVDENLISSTFSVMVQVNGKTRGKVQVCQSFALDKKGITSTILNSSIAQKYLQSSIRKTIVVMPKKKTSHYLVNFVLD